MNIAGVDILSFLILVPLVGAVSMFFLPESKPGVSRAVAVFWGALAFAVSLFVLASYSNEKLGFQFEVTRAWIPLLGVHYALGIDGLSIWLVMLTTLLSLLVLVAAGNVSLRPRAYLGSLLLLEVGMLGTFLSLDGLLFYVFWEVMLVPMYFLIGVWGGKRRVYAALKFVLYTALGSLLMLVAIVYLAYAHREQFGHPSFLLSDWTKLAFSPRESLLLFGAFALAFSIKIPLFPFHTWLPDAHVEAPTGGSVILAGVLLKMGLYGLIRFCIPVFPEETLAAAPLFAILAVIGIIYGALMAWVQDDIKKLVAYSSVSHLGFCVLGYAAISVQGMQACVLQMLNHGISTGALFLLVGALYGRKHTRLISDYGGLAAKVPIFAAVYMVFTLSSIGLPTTNGFVGEFLIILSAVDANWVLGAFAVSGIILGAVYMLSLYRRVVFGPLDEAKNGDLEDLGVREILVFLPLLLLVFGIGLYPAPVLDAIEPSSEVAIDRLLPDEKPDVADSARTSRPSRVVLSKPGDAYPKRGRSHRKRGGSKNISGKLVTGT